jgi:hypothetical protein
LGIEKATGGYLTFVDSDDELTCDALQILYDLILKYEADVSMGGFSNIRENGKQVFYEKSGKNFLWKNDEILSKVLENFQTLDSACAKLYKKELFKNLRFVKGKLHEDMFFEHRLLGVTNKFVYCNEPLYFYLTRPQSIMANLKEKNYMHIYDSFVDRFNYLNEVKNYDPNKNKLMFLANIRYLYTITPIKYKDLKKKLLNEYKALYKHVNNKCFKEFAFYHFRWLFLLLLKIRKNK